jgi:hypothetical protein
MKARSVENKFCAKVTRGWENFNFIFGLEVLAISLKVLSWAHTSAVLPFLSKLGFC